MRRVVRPLYSSSPFRIADKLLNRMVSYATHSEFDKNYVYAGITEKRFCRDVAMSLMFMFDFLVLLEI